MPCEFNLRLLAVSFIINLFAYPYSSFQVNLHSIIYKYFQKQLHLKTEKLICHGYHYFSYDKKQVFDMKPSSHGQDLKLWKVSLDCSIFQGSGPSCLIPAASNSHHLAIELSKTSRNTCTVVKTCLDDFRNSFLPSVSICYHIGSILVHSVNFPS